jgi:hypothetical protein
VKEEANSGFVLGLPGAGDERTWPRRFRGAADETIVSTFATLADFPADVRA